MKRYIAILRGINVGGKRKIKMADLRTQLLESGFENVESYIQSGNLAFDSAETDEQKIAKSIKSLILDQYGHDVPTIVLSRELIISILNENPFIGDGQRDEALVHITFLAEKPDEALVKTLDTSAYLPDEFAISERAVYLYIVNGYRKTKLSNNFFEKKLKVTATTRNLKTSRKLAEMAG